MTRDNSKSPKNTLLNRGPAMPVGGATEPGPSATVDAPAVSVAPDPAVVADPDPVIPDPVMIGPAPRVPAPFMPPSSDGPDNAASSTVLGPCASAALDPTAPVASRPRVRPIRSPSTGALYLPQETAGWHTPAEAIGLAHAIVELYPELGQ